MYQVSYLAGNEGVFAIRPTIRRYLTAIQKKMLVLTPVTTYIHNIRFTNMSQRRDIRQDVFKRSSDHTCW
jgi:hypothetical protein